MEKPDLDGMMVQARVGAFGRGFAVVAEQVGIPAGQTAEASKNTSLKNLFGNDSKRL